VAKHSKNKNVRDLYRGINEFKKGHYPGTNLVKNENGDLLADSHKILTRWKNYLFQLLNTQRVIDVRQIEIHTTRSLVPQRSPFEVQIVIAK
jgi:hypothetical protein